MIRRSTMFAFALALAFTGSASAQDICKTLDPQNPKDRALIEDCKKGAEVDAAIDAFKDVFRVTTAIIDSSPAASAAVIKMLEEQEAGKKK